MKIKLFGQKIYLIFFVTAGISGFSQDYNVQSIPENLLQNTNAVIREQTENYVLNSVKDLKISQTKVTTILNKSGEDFSNVLIPYNPTTKVSNIKVEVFDELGKSIKTYGKKDFSDYSNNPSAALYVDDRILVFKPIVTKYPYTVKYSYETNTSNTVYLSNYRPFGSFNIALQKSECWITNNSGIKVRTKINNKPLASVSVSENGNVSKYSYQNIPALKDEEFAPTLDYLIPNVEFSPEKFTLEGKEGDMTDWNAFGKWYYNQLIVPVSKITPEISAEVTALNLQGTTAEKVKKLYQYMQDKTRYVLIAMGIGGWQPMPASEVSKKGYGDCKALTNYMRTLLTAAGIPSYYSVINDGRSAISFDQNFPKLSGNHVILMVPTEKDPIWLENTVQKFPYNHLSYTSHNRNVLAVNENGIVITNTPSYKSEESKEKIKAKVILAADGGFTSTANFEFTGGQYDQILPLLDMKKDEMNLALKNRHEQLKISNILVQNLKNDFESAKLGYDLELKASHFAKQIGDEMFFPVMPFYPTSSFSMNEERSLPFELSFPFQDDYEIEYHLPAGYQFSQIPDATTIETEFGTYQILYHLNDNKLQVHRILTIKKGIYPKEKFKDYIAFRKKTAGNDNTKILISKL